MKVRIVSTGRTVPQQRVTTEALERDHGMKAGELLTATGVSCRFQCDQETQVELAATACRIALSNASIDRAQIDLVISGASVPYQPIPATAPLVMREIGMKDGTACAFDINSTCLSFLTALETAAMRIDAGLCTRALVFSSEIASSALPWQEQPDVAALFGDGAAAAVLEPSAHDDTGVIVASLMRSYPSAWEACGIGAGGTRYHFDNDREAFVQNAKFAMDGKELFRITSRHFPSFLDELLDRAGWARDEVHLVIPHQASPLALDHMVRGSGFAPDRVVNLAAEFGNQIAASIPFALDMAREDGRFARGDKLLLVGTSAGVSFGGMALVW